MAPQFYLRRTIFASAIVLGSIFATAVFSEERGACATIQDADEFSVPNARLAALARGVNLPGWLDSMTPREPDRALLLKLRSHGFTHIRLPLQGELVMSEFSSEDLVKQMLDRLDGALDELNQLGFAVSIDVHPDSRFSTLHQTQPELALKALESAWELLASRNKKRDPDRVFFEVLNEPSVEDALWREQAQQIVAAIRRVAPKHTIIVGPATYQRIDALTSWEPLPEPNIVYAVHFYDPMIFTHQGADWVRSDPLAFFHNVPFPTDRSDLRLRQLRRNFEKRGLSASVALMDDSLAQRWDSNRIRASFDELSAWMRRYRRPVVLNEFGVLRKAAPARDRAFWIYTVRKEAERIRVGWAHWELQDGFGLAGAAGKRVIPDPSVIKALVEEWK